jgi:hypothetical protein
VTSIAINDVGKLVIILVAIVGGFALATASLFTHETAGLTAGVGLVGTALGYVAGNGRLASRSEPPSTLLAPQLDSEKFVHVDQLEALEQLKEASDARERVAAKVSEARRT